MKNSHTGTFFWVTTHTESLPRTPIEVIPADFTALNAYSGSFRESHTNEHHPPHEWRKNQNLTSHTCTIDSMFDFTRTEYLTTYVIVPRHFISLFTYHLLFEVDRSSFSKCYVLCNGHWMKKNQKLTTSDTYVIDSIFDSTCSSAQLHTWWYVAILSSINLHLNFLHCY